jgi:hypothetical protein
VATLVVEILVMPLALAPVAASWTVELRGVIARLIAIWGAVTIGSTV